MFELIEIIDFMLTRDVRLKNLETNVIDECFDDSELISKDNFGFMQIGQQYECKIRLCGIPVIRKNAILFSVK